MSKVYIICRNDSMVLASLTEVGLAGIMEELAKKHYKKLVSQGHLKRFRSQEAESFKDYRQHIYWHIHEVELAEGSVDRRIQELEHFKSIAHKMYPKRMHIVDGAVEYAVEMREALERG